MRDYRPISYDISTIEGAKLYKELQTEHPELIFQDLFAQHWKEWFKLQNPAKQLGKEQLDACYDALPEKEKMGVIWYYPWLRKAVHTLGQEAFVAVRTNRNQLKITFEEQKKLGKKSVGVIGLSVGSAIALTIAMERVAGTIKLADFDDIELSNTNRLYASLTDQGQNKAVLAARKIAELDPYLDVEVFADGLHDGNANAFFEGLDLVIEECDHLPVKVLARKLARARRLPLLMETNDRGMLDVERFDLEPERPLLHGLLPEEPEELNTLNSEERLQMVKKLISWDLVSPRLKESFAEMGKTLSAWPQLASSVMIGGGVVTEVSRQILLGKHTKSGRYYFDAQEVLNGMHMFSQAKKDKILSY